MANERSMVDQMAVKMRDLVYAMKEKADDQKRQVREQVKAAQGGCLIVIAVLAVLTAALGAGVVHLLA